MQNFVELIIKYFFYPKNVTFRVWGWKLAFDNLGPKDSSSHKFGNLASIFTKKTSFYPESQVQFSKIIRS